MHKRTKIVVITAVLFSILLLIIVIFTARERNVLPIDYESASQLGVPGFPIVERTIQTLRPEEYLPLLMRHVQQFPDDPNNSYYLMVIGDVYYNQNADNIARQYYRRAFYVHPDIYVRTISTHRVAITRLLSITQDPEERIEYMLYLRAYYPEHTNTGEIAYYLGQAFAEAGRWKEAYESYRDFLRFPGTQISGDPDAHRRILQQVDLYDSNRIWTYKSLNELTQVIKNALVAQSPSALLKNRAGRNFFTMSWQQEEADANSEIPSFDIGAFLRRSRIHFASELDMASNADEAYLRTWGWSHRIPTWYLYFRRVHFPADPEIHGSWEWAGIFFWRAAVALQGYKIQLRFLLPIL